MATRKVAIVTGSNKGIGFAIVKGLCEKYDGDVYITARDVGRGQAAVDVLKRLGYSPLFHQLDITDQKSVDDFQDYIKEKHGGIDILINNAGIAFKNDATESFGIQAKETLHVNYFGTLRVCQALFPLLRHNAKVINISSVCGHLSKIPSANLRAELKSESLDIPALTSLMEKFIKDSEDGNNIEEGWGSSAYNASKVGVSALSFVQQRMLDAEVPNRNIAVNSIHPGYVDTDMSSHKGPLTIEQGARGALILALKADFKGKYVWKDGKPVDWEKPLQEAI